jgi:hypothetical protein
MDEEIRGREPQEEGQEPVPTSQAEGIEKLIKDLRQEAASYRRRLRELEAVLSQEREQRERAVEEERKARAEWERRFLEAQRALRERTLRYEVLFHAQRLGAQDPDLVWRALDGEALSRIEWEEDAPKGVEEVVREFLEKRPFLVRSASGVRVAPTNPPREGAVFRRSEMRDPSFWQKHRVEDVMRALAEGRVIDDLS